MARSEWTDGLEILDLVHESIFARTRDLRITFWNAAAEELYGWTRDEALGRNADELLQCVHPMSLEDRESQLFATGRWQGEFGRRTKSGSEILVDATWSVRRNEAGEPIEVVETGRDATEKRRDEEARRLSEYRFRNLFQAMAVGFCEVDFNGAGALLIPLRDAGVTDLRQYLVEHPEMVRKAMRLSRILDVNDKMLSQLAGSSKEEMVGSNVERFWPEASIPVFIDALVGAMEKQPHLITETRLLDLNGEEVDVLFTVSWSPESRKQGIILLGIVDIGDRKRAFEALAQSELKYRDLFHHMPLALVQLDVSELIKVLGRLRVEGVSDLEAYMDAHPDFLGQMLQIMRVEQVNDHTVRMFGGHDPAEFVGPIARFWQGSEDTVRRSLAARYAGAEAYAEETRLTTLDGRVIDAFYTSAFPKALSGLGIGLVGMIDIGDRLQAERMLQQVQADFAHAARVATLGELTASIAHEINQPLAAIATNGEASLRWLARPEPDVEEVKALAARMVADARRAADVIAQIRAMATGQALEHEPILVNAAVEEALSFLRRELQTHEVSVEFVAGPRLPPVRGERTQIQQVLVNLAVNAIQAMADQPVAERRLTIRTSIDAGGGVRIEVDDSGPGIPDGDVGRLFDSFFTTKKGGLGIGLSICRSIIEAHGGRIGCESLPAGGARFRIILSAAIEGEPT